MQIIIEYIVKYQDDFVSSFLFQKNFPTLLEKGIEVKKLLDSHVFNYEFDLDEWPSTHNNPQEELRPFNQNLFLLRQHYKTVFPEDEFIPLDEQKNDSVKVDNSKVYKIKYSLNLLPSIGTYLHKETDPYTKQETSCLKNEDINLLA